MENDAEIKRLTEENEALRKEMLTPSVFARLTNWLGEKNPKPASSAFTAGMERQIAYALEIDVLPVVKQLQIQLTNALAKIESLERGEYICKRCGLRKDGDQGQATF